MSSVTVVQGPTFSDGDPSHRPSGPGFVRANEAGYLQKLAEKWMQDAGVAEDDKTYSLANLPAGYEVWERPRLNNPNHSDKWLYGHPNHQTFDSPNRFYPHFVFLMHTGNQDCTCVKCTNQKSKLRSTMSSVPKVPLLKEPFDEEGTPGNFQNFLTVCKSEDTMGRKIEERAGMAWQAEQALVESTADSSSQSFVPRHGEIVMYVSLPEGHELRQDRRSHNFKIFKIYDTGKSRAIGSPQWFAGIVTEKPSSIPDNAEFANVAGFRIEPLPTLGSTNNDEHIYTTLDLIRPFTFWKSVLSGVPEDKWHPSIHAAITACATTSLIDRHAFKPNWPHARIESSGIFIGTESYWIGDMVRLHPQALSDRLAGYDTPAVMQIENIISHFYYLRVEPDGTGNTCESMDLWLHGPVYILSDQAEDEEDDAEEAEEVDDAEEGDADEDNAEEGDAEEEDGQEYDAEEEDGQEYDAEEEDDAEEEEYDTPPTTAPLPHHAQPLQMHHYPTKNHTWRPLLPSPLPPPPYQTTFAIPLPHILSRLYEHSALHKWFPALPASPEDDPKELLGMGLKDVEMARGRKVWRWAGGRRDALGLVAEEARVRRERKEKEAGGKRKVGSESGEGEDGGEDGEVEMRGPLKRRRVG